MNPNIYEYDENCQTGRRLAVFVFAGPKLRFFILYEVFLLAVRFHKPEYVLLTPTGFLVFY